MKVVYSALVVDSNSSVLSPERQIAVAVAKALSKKVKISSMTVVGWPLLLLRMEDTGAYMVFDETGSIDTSFNTGILQNYSAFLEKLSQLRTPEEFMSHLASISWGELRGIENFKLKGVIGKDLTPLLKNVSLSLNLFVLEKRLTEERASLELDEWRKVQQNISSDIEKVDQYIRSLTTVSEVFIGKLAEERQKVEAKFKAEIDREQQSLEELLRTRKPQAYEEVKKKLTEYTPKLAEIYGVLSKAQLDLEAGLVSEKQVRVLMENRDRVIREIDGQVNSVLENYRAEIRSFRERIQRLKEEKKKEMDKLDERIQALRGATERVKAELTTLRKNKEAELNQLASLARRTIFADERVEVLVPFLVVKDEYGLTHVVSPQMYSGRVRSIFGFGTKLENVSSPIHNDISDMETRLSSMSFPDNVKSMGDDLEKGIEWLESEGWKVRKAVEEYYLS